MAAMSTLLLVVTEPDVVLRPEHHEQIAGMRLFTEQARDFGYLYTADDGTCIDLADRIADRLWLLPRRQTGLDTAGAWLSLLNSHRYDNVVAVVPSSALGATLEQLSGARAKHDELIGLRCTTLRGRPSLILQLALCAPPT